LTTSGHLLANYSRALRQQKIPGCRLRSELSLDDDDEDTDQEDTDGRPGAELGSGPTPP